MRFLLILLCFMGVGAILAHAQTPVPSAHPTQELEKEKAGREAREKRTPSGIKIYSERAKE